MYRGVMSHYSENWCKIWRKTDLLFDEFWPKHSKVSKYFTFFGSYSAMYLMCDLKKYRHDTEEGCKI